MSERDGADVVAEQVRELARLGQGPRLKRTRHGRVLGRRLLAVTGVVAVLGGPIVLGPPSLLRADGSGASATTLLPEPDPAPAVEGEPDEAVDQWRSFARHEDVELVIPAVGVRLVAFHEASFADARALEPVGRPLRNNNTTKFAPPEEADGFDYVVLSSRGRSTPATSAADVALEPDTPVSSLVTGTIADVETYFLYGRYPDARIEIVPEGREDLRVVIIHVEDVLVSPGDRVVAGETLLARRATQFPFVSQIDRHVPDPPGPHIHVEVKAEGR